MPNNTTFISDIDMEELILRISCPVTKQIFKTPVKLLLENRGDDTGVIIERDVYAQLTSRRHPLSFPFLCPISNKPIYGAIRVREIESIVDWFLQLHPEKRQDQYAPLVPYAHQKPIPVAKSENNTISLVRLGAGMYGAVYGPVYISDMVVTFWRNMYDIEFWTTRGDAWLPCFYLILSVGAVLGMLSMNYASDIVEHVFYPPKALDVPADEPREARLRFFNAQPAPRPENNDLQNDVVVPQLD